MNELNFRCAKCGNTDYEIGEIRAAGGFWSKIFEVAGSRYSSVTCTKCKFTEFYKAESSLLGNIFDLFTS